jgi:peptidoglycan-associated lipoprotein
VYFGFDSTSLSAGEKAKLHGVAEAAKSGSTIIIAGFTDERGTPEYNRGLGERRALTVREELIALGASAGRLQTVSFGEEMPADSGSGDSAWAKNRRAEFGVTR